MSSQNIPPPLPPGWKAQLDAKSGKFYFYNVETRAQQWEPPPLNLAPGWRAARDESGHQYYMNLAFGYSQWDWPPQEPAEKFPKKTEHAAPSGSSQPAPVVQPSPAPVDQVSPAPAVSPTFPQPASQSPAEVGTTPAAQTPADEAAAMPAPAAAATTAPSPSPAASPAEGVDVAQVPTEASTPATGAAPSTPPTEVASTPAAESAAPPPSSLDATITPRPATEGAGEDVQVPGTPDTNQPAPAPPAAVSSPPVVEATTGGSEPPSPTPVPPLSPATMTMSTSPGPTPSPPRSTPPEAAHIPVGNVLSGVPATQPMPMMPQPPHPRTPRFIGAAPTHLTTDLPYMPAQQPMAGGPHMAGVMSGPLPQMGPMGPMAPVPMGVMGYPPAGGAAPMGMLSPTLGGRPPMVMGGPPTMMMPPGGAPFVGQRPHPGGMMSAPLPMMAGGRMPMPVPPPPQPHMAMLSPPPVRGPGMGPPPQQQQQQHPQQQGVLTAPPAAQLIVRNSGPGPVMVSSPPQPRLVAPAPAPAPGGPAPAAPHPGKVQGAPVPPPPRSTVPPGYKLVYSKLGVPSLVIDKSGGGTEAAMEHQEVRVLKMGSSLKEIETQYGTGVSLYFVFLRFIIFLNFWLGCIALGNFIPSLAHVQLSSLTGFINIFYIESYSPEVWIYWIITACAAVGCSLLAGYANKRRADTEKELKREALMVDMDTINKYLCVYDIDGNEEALTMDINVVHPLENKYVRTSSHYTRLFFSYLLFVIMLVAGGVAVYFITWGGKKLSTVDFWGRDWLLSIIVSVANTAVRQCWAIMCRALTNFEKHKFWSGYRRHTLVKLFLFKFLNAGVLYFSQYFVYSAEDSSSTATTCPLADAGTQFLVNYIIDILVFCGTGTLLPIFRFYCLRSGGKSGKKKNSDYKDEFDTAEEHLDVLYRQFILFLAGTIVPMVYFLGFVGAIIGYYLDKLRVIRLCSVKPMHTSPHKLLLWVLILTALAAVFIFPNGILWILLKWPESRFTQCTFFK
ncbi:putative DUF590 family protein [Paratrimastix pyriformis]|uniref:DUF590 family protein n=1 Tax=Paratrimastix pyriformis TaxID=342808 RepID=A0ABQ8UHW4_9EUKA|nr:putative DUF590 family protein [Paratrimastix pyriformis]